jgi:hypothetical protein
MEGVPVAIDHNLIIDSSIVHSPMSDNTCMFYALYYTLRTTELRIAFGDENGVILSSSFTNMFNQEHLLEKIEVKGYSSGDTRVYLDYLRAKCRKYFWDLKNGSCLLSSVLEVGLSRRS